MSFTKSIVNSICRKLQPHEDAVQHIQALCMWNRPKYSAIFVAIIELIFLVIYLLPFSKLCNYCLVFGSGIIFKCVYGAFPNVINTLLSFEIEKVPQDAPNRIRTVPEISAFLTTVLSIWTRIFEAIFASLKSTAIYENAVGLLILLGMGLVTFFIGDFWFIFLMFHIFFILPGGLLHPTVQKWLNEEPKEETPQTDVKQEEDSSDGNEQPPKTKNE